MTDKARICKCCGAPLHGYKCDYCGVEYERPHDYVIPHIIYREGDVKTLACKCNMPLSDIQCLGEEESLEHIKYDMARKMTEQLINYMEVETWISPEIASQTFGGKIKVVVPREGR